jgi:hypothetical protein
VVDEVGEALAPIVGGTWLADPVLGLGRNTAIALCWKPSASALERGGPKREVLDPHASASSEV